MNLNFSNKNFNPLFYKYRGIKKRFILSRGGGGSGKSHSTAQHLLLLMMECDIRILVVRKVATTLKDSVWILFLDLIEKWNLKGFDINITDKTITFNKSKILFKGMDDPEKIKSITSINIIWVEEATELELDDFEQLNLRLRGVKNPQIILTFNPISKENWIWKRFYETRDPNAHYLKSTWKHNRFLDDEYSKQLERYKNLDYQKYQIYALGEWGTSYTGYEFYRNFKDTSITDCKWNPDLPLHISFDENVNPYISAIIAQVSDKRVKIIDEIVMRDPLNTIKDLCEAILYKYRDHSSGVFIYGDATSRKADTKIEKGSNFFYLILGHLKDWHPTLRVPNSNPPVKLRGDWINEIFFDGKSGINIEVGTGCNLLINDLKEIKQQADGTKLKTKERDKKTGVTYEKWGHLSDCLDYLLCELFREDFDIYRRGGVKIQIPKLNPIKRRLF